MGNIRLDGRNTDRPNQQGHEPCRVGIAGEVGGVQGLFRSRKWVGAPSQSCARPRPPGPIDRPHRHPWVGGARAEAVKPGPPGHVSWTFVNRERIVQHSPDGDFQPAILAAARARFRRFGYAKTSMQEIAGDCGGSAANLYRHYDGKLAIGAAVAAAGQAALFADCDRAVAAVPGDLAAKLVTLFHALIDGTCRQIKSTPLLFELDLTVAREQPHHRQRFLQETEARIAKILVECGPAEAWAANDVRATSRMILMAGAPFVLPWMLRTQPFGNPRVQVEPLMKCLVAGLTRAGAAGSAAAVRHCDALE